MIRPLVSTIFSIVLIMLSSFKRSPFGRRLLASRLAPIQKQCPVPQEIIDMIIDLLRDDIGALKACSLASSIFVFRARKYLFNKSVIAISGMARRAPHINLLIRDALHPRGTLNIHSMKRISLEYPLESKQFVRLLSNVTSGGKLPDVFRGVEYLHLTRVMSLPLNLGMGLSGFVSVTHLVLFHRVSFHNAQVFWDVIRSFENLISLYWASTPDPLWIPCEVATPLTLDPRLPQHLEQITICSFILHEPAIFDLLLRLRHQIKYWGITEVDTQIELPRLLPYLGELFATADAEVQHWMFVLSDAFVESTDGFTGIDDLDLEEEGVAEFCSDIKEHIDVKKNTYVQSLVFRGRLWRCLLEGSILKFREGKTALKTVIFEDHWAEEYDDSDSDEEVL